MRLTLRLRSHCGKPPDQHLEKSFDRFPVVIGRSPACDFVLQDPSKYISSNHAILRMDASQILIEDTSSNGAYLNGSTESIGRGKSAVVKNGDSLTIGDYCLSIEMQGAAASTADNAALNDRSPRPAVAPADLDPFDPFRDEPHDWTPPSQARTADDFWDLDETPAMQMPSSSAADSVWDDWPAAGESAADPAPPSNPSPSGTSDQDLDWLPDVSAQTVSTPSPIKHAGSVPIAPKPPHPPPRRPPKPLSNIRSDDHAALSSAVQVVLQAAGLDPRNYAGQDAEQVLKSVGRILGLSLEGVMQLLHSRAELKNAIRADVTRLARNNNNPLKFSASAEDALDKLLLPKNRKAYQQADTSITEAVEDLKAHQLAMLEGMKAAVHAMLKQFDPQTLEHKLESVNPIAANIPITRDAKLWQLFNERFNEIHDEAVSDFNELFGKEFRKAYDQRIRQLGRKPDF